MARPDTERLGKSVEVSLGALRLVGACCGQVCCDRAGQSRLGLDGMT